MPRETLLDFFQDFAGLEDEFLIYDDGFRARHYRYREIAEQARAFAGRLREQGIGRDEKVILYGENRPEWIIGLWGCLLEGVIAVPIDYRSSPEFVERIQAIVGARAILTGDEAGMYEGHASGQPVTITPPSLSKDQTAEIIFTSGATAEPKGVIITHRNILANIVPVEGEVKKYLRYACPFAPIRFLNLLPLSHMFGQAMATFIPPMLPGVVVFMRSFHPNEILRQIRTRRISVLVSVPQILEILRAHLIQMFPELRQLKPWKGHWLRRWWRYRKVHRLFGWKFWSFIVGAAPFAGRSGSVLLRTRIPGDPRLRPHRDRADRDPESSVPRSQGQCWQTYSRRRGQDRFRWRDPGARRERDFRILSASRGDRARL
jgi:long-chain acyl-CoA synthetase